MKKKVLVSLIISVISMAFLCSLNSPSKNYTANAIGGYMVYEGVTGEKGGLSEAGKWVAGLGGGALAEGAGVALGIFAGSNPLGWAIGGVCAIL